jgi:hypothetical protein
MATQALVPDGAQVAGPVMMATVAKATFDL